MEFRICDFCNVRNSTTSLCFISWRGSLEQLIRKLVCLLWVTFAQFNVRTWCINANLNERVLLWESSKLLATSMLFAHSLVCNDQSYMTSISVVHDSEISPMISRYVCELTFIRISVIFKHQLYLSHALIFLYAIFVTWLWLSHALISYDLVLSHIRHQKT